jgi:hypothetical protein
MEALKEQIEAAVNSPAGIDGDQAIELARKTSGNFVSEMLRLIYAPIRKLVHRAAVPALVGGADVYNQQIVAFIVNNADQLKVFASLDFHGA